MTSDAVVLELRITQADWAAYQKLVVERLRAGVGTARRLAAVLAPLAVGGLLVYQQMSSRGQTNSRVALAFCIGMCAMLVSILWASQLFQKQSLPDPDGYILGSVRMELSSEGIRTFRATSEGITQWSTLREITQTDTHLFLWLDRLAAYIVPLRDLPESPEALLETIRGFAGPMPVVRIGPGAGASSARALARSSSTETDALPMADASETPVPRPGFLATLARRLAWLRLPADAGRIGSSDAMILACASAALAVWLGYDRYVAGAHAEWYLGGLTSVVWYATGVLALAWVLHLGSLRSAAFRPLLAAIVAGLPLVLALGVSIELWAPGRARWAGYALLAVAALAYLKRSLDAAGAGSIRLALLSGALFAALFAAATSAAWVHPHLWYANDEDDDSDSSWAGSEKLLYAQPDRIDAAAARMSAGLPARPDVFFVGFAGVADQKVFAEELKLAERVVTERYGAAGRSLLLVNDRRDRDSWPIATVEGLRRALAKVGARMDRTQDVLFLMLTSHGSDDPSLSVSNGAWPLEQLGGKELRAALDESGIRWRVIVISACHAGAFIEPLANESTIVLAAAAKDRTSFGCSDLNDLTYFGQALLRDALPQAESLASAFERAKQLVAEREKSEKLEASRPEAYYGSAISPYWNFIEAARQANGAAGRKREPPQTDTETESSGGKRNRRPETESPAGNGTKGRLK